MLTDVTLDTTGNGLGAILAMVAASGNRSRDTVRHETGLYEIGHWNFDNCVKENLDGYGFGDGADDNIGFGVCDSIEQFKRTEWFERVVQSANKYAVSFVVVRKDDQPDVGGWRWHKWGAYCGEMEPQCEYLKDEPVIEQACTFHVYRVLD